MPVAHRLKVADEVWIATALLHREQPAREDFSIKEIVERAREEGLSEVLRAGVYVHAIQHCVANRPPNPARYRMLFETGPNRRRLYRPGDHFHPARHGGKCVPIATQLPGKYRPLLTWHATAYGGKSPRAAGADPLLAMKGSGKALWAKEHADRYVGRLRRGWQ